MKKIMSILVMVLLVLSVAPMVVAERQDMNKKGVSVEDGDLTVSDDNDTEEPESVGNAKQLREASKEFTRAKQAYQRASKDTKESRQSFLQSKKQLKSCTDESEECVALREQVNQHAKDLVLNGIDGAIEHLNQLKAKMESSEDIEDVESVIANIDTAIAELEETKAEVEVAESKAEIKSIARDVKTLWSRIRNKERVYAAKLVHAKVFNIIKRAENLEVKLERLVARLEAKGVDVTTLEENLAEFNTNIEAARAKYEEGKALIGEDAKQARNTIKEAHNLVKKAQSALMNLVRGFRNAGSDVSEADEEEEEELGNETDGEGEEQ